MARVVHQMIMHDEESNDYLATSVPMKVRLCLELKQKMPESDWTQVLKWLMEKYGEKKKAAMNRWITAARTLPESALTLMEQRLKERGLKHGIHQAFVFTNPWLVGLEATRKDSVHRLSETYVGIALQLLFRDLDESKVSAQDFQKRICRTLKYISTWITRIERVFPQSVLDAVPTWAPLKNSLCFNEALFRQVTKAMDEQQFKLAEAIVECKVVYQQFQRLAKMAATNPDDPSGATNTTDPAAADDMELEGIAGTTDLPEPSPHSKQSEARANADLFAAAVRECTAHLEVAAVLQKRKAEKRDG